MPIPTSIADLSENESLNSPQGGDPVGGQIDNFFRAHGSIIKKQYARGSNITASATLQVPVDGTFFFVVTGAINTITGIADAFNGKTVWLRFNSGITLTHSAGLVLPGAVNKVTGIADTALFVNESPGVWRCLSYTQLQNNALQIGNNLSDVGSAATARDNLGIPENFISKTGDRMTGILEINTSAESYVRGMLSGTNNWYVGKGGGGNNDISLSSYVYNTSLVLLPDRVQVNRPFYVGTSVVYTDTTLTWNILQGKPTQFPPSDGSTYYAPRGATVSYLTSTVEFAAVTTAGTTVDLTGNYVVTGLRTTAAGSIFLRGRQMRNY